MDCGKCRICGNDIEEKCGRCGQESGTNTAYCSDCFVEKYEEIYGKGGEPSNTHGSGCLCGSHDPGEVWEAGQKELEELPTAVIAYNDDPTMDRTHYQTFLDPDTEFGEKMLKKFDEVGRDYDELVRRKDVLKLFGEIINDFEELGPSTNYDSAMHLVHEYRQKIANVEKKTDEVDK